MRRKVLARSVRSVIEMLESRTLLSAGHVVHKDNVVNVGTGLASFTGTVVDNNGVIVPGATVFLDLNMDNTLDAGDPNTVTDAMGSFTFNNVAGPTTYWVEVIPNNGFENAPPGHTSVTVPAVGAVVQPVTVSEIPIPGTSLSGIVEYSNGTLIPNATVFLDLNSDNTLDATDPNTITDANGAFTFSNVAAGSTYRVEAVPQPGYEQAPPGFVSVTLPAVGPNIQGAVIKEINTPGISGILFNDVVESGIYQPQNGDVPLAGDTVFVDANGNGQLDPGELTATTGPDGSFNLAEGPGTYQLKVIPRTGFHQDAPGEVTVTVGTSGLAIANIGESTNSAVSGVVFLDANGNGSQDAGEAGVAGEAVNILGVSGAATGYSNSTTTDANGNYVLGNLPAGLYELTVTSNAGYAQDAPSYAAVTITGGQAITQNIGEGLPTTVTGVVFDDKNANGVQDTGEPGISGQTVYLDTNLNGVQDAAGTVGVNGVALPAAEPAAVTDTNGAYSITGYQSGGTVVPLGPGTYTARVIAPAGAVVTGPTTTASTYTFTLGSGQTLSGESFGFESADLTVQTISFPTKPVMGGVLQKATFRVTNVGSRTASGSVALQLYASTTNTFTVSNATNVYVSPGQNLTLAPGKSKVFKLRFAYPVTLPTATYYVNAEVLSSVNDNNASNNFSVLSAPVQITMPFIDLSSAYVGEPLATTFPGNATPLNFAVTNHGNVATTGTLSFLVYLTTTNVLEPTDSPVQITRSNVRIKAGATKTFHVKLFSAGLGLGSRYIQVFVNSADPLGEANTTNNLLTTIAPTNFL